MRRATVALIACAMVPLAAGAGTTGTTQVCLPAVVSIDASEVPITDAAGYFAETDVEAALAALRVLAPRAYATDGDLPAECGPEESWALVWASETYGEGPGLFVCPEAEGAWVPLTASGGGNVEDGATACAAGEVPTSQGDTTLACAPPVTAEGLDALDAIQYSEGPFGDISLTAGTTDTGQLSLGRPTVGLTASGASAAITLQATDDSAPYNVTLALGGGTAAATLNNSDIVTAAYSGTIAADTSGNAGTATTLAANGANCAAGNYPLGVDASGAAESCTAVTATNVEDFATADTNDGYVLTSDGLGGVAFEAAAGGGIGGSTGATDDALLCADGTGGATLQACNAASSFAGSSLTGPSGGLSLIGGPGATDDLTLDGSAATAGAVTVSELGSITVPTGGSLGAPRVHFGSVGSGCWEVSSGTLACVANGSNATSWIGWEMNSSSGQVVAYRGSISNTSGLDLPAVTANGIGALDAAVSSIDPSLIPDSSDADTGIGRAGANDLRVIAGATSALGVTGTLVTSYLPLALPVLASAPYTCNSGAPRGMYVDNTDDPDVLCWCNGTAWTPIPSGDCT